MLGTEVARSHAALTDAVNLTDTGHLHIGNCVSVWADVPLGYCELSLPYVNISFLLHLTV